MTTGRKFGKDEAFEAWIRKHPELDSSLGYIRYDIDIIWGNWKTKKFMMLSKKTHGKMGYSRATEKKIYETINKALSKMYGTHYLGLHQITFSGEGPEDSGSIFLDGERITNQELLGLLKSCG